MVDRRPILVVVKAGPLADGILGVLETTPGICIGGRADDVPAALAATAQRPSEVILDCEPSGVDVVEAVRQIKNAWPDCRCIALAEDVPQQDAAVEAGADVVLLKGCQPADLIAAVEKPS